MTDLLIRGVDPGTIKRLKERAKQAGRSLQAEAKKILEESGEKMSMGEARKEIKTIRRKLGKRKFPDSVDLIREDRDR